jgi:predicted MFS family arabinose efflux permease
MPPHSKMKSYTTFMMCCTVFFLFADQNILAPNLSAIAEDFNMSDEERDEMLGGYIAFGFFVVGGPVALLVGYLADTVNRPLLFGLVVAFGELATFCAYWVTNYAELFVCRVLTGISIGGAAPIIFSMLGDMYPEESRIYVSTLIGISLGAGISGGQLLSGMVGPELGWRAPFLFVAIPSLICAALVFFTVHDPPRGDQEKETRRLRELGVTLNQAAHNPMVTFNHTAGPQDEESKEGYHGDIELNRLESGSSSFRSADHSGFQLSQSEHLHEPVSNRSSDESQSGVTDMDTSVSFSQQSAHTLQDVHDEHNEHGPDGAAVHVTPAEYSERITWDKVRQLFRTRSVVVIFIQGFPGCLPWGMIFVFLNDYFSTDRGMTVRSATAALTAFGLGGLTGQMFGGWVGQKLYNRDPRLQCVLMGGTTMLSVLPMLYLLNTRNVTDTGFYVMAVIAGFMVSMNGPNVRAVLQVRFVYFAYDDMNVSPTLTSPNGPMCCRMCAPRR